MLRSIAEFRGSKRSTMYRGTYLNEFLNLVNLLESICNVFEIIVEVIGEVIGKIIDQTFRLRLREITYSRIGRWSIGRECISTDFLKLDVW